MSFDALVIPTNETCSKTISDTVLRQLLARPELVIRANPSPEEKVLYALANAVAKEKGLNTPRQLHRDDTAWLLFCGDCDDLTPLEFRVNLRKSMGIELTRDAANKICEPGVTVAMIQELALAGR